LQERQRFGHLELAARTARAAADLASDASSALTTS